MHLGIVVLVDFADLTFGMVMIHLFTTPQFFHDMFKAIPSTGENHILFIDGDCLFCQNTAKYFISIDKKKVLNFAPLQGETAKSLLPETWRELKDDNGSPTGAIALLENPGTEQEKRYQEFDALFRTLRLIGGPLSFIQLFSIAPKSFKSRLYHFIAKNRHHLHFLLPKNARNSCPLPDQATRSRYLS